MPHAPARLSVPSMHVVRLHPGGMPESEHYTLSELRVNRYLKKPDMDGADARSIGYPPNGATRHPLRPGHESGEASER